ncbi:MAG: MotA/TolQ/ExbB proton channel family protein [Bdellovibrionales bacterium]|nr:MotA/TolQ/ExbB proton channel family protein [Bdellovibrionales bacterium]
MLNPLELIQTFLESGGQVLWVILIATFVLWALIVERFLFIKFNFPEIVKDLSRSWNQRSEYISWSSHRIREATISKVDQSLNQFLGTIKALVALCPLLGLLGTVTGMINVFDVMAAVGNGNTRSMASGISMATIPTMAGMVASISGIYFSSVLEKKVKLCRENLSEILSIE